jgi:hypothetical protein
LEKKKENSKVEFGVYIYRNKKKFILLKKASEEEEEILEMDVELRKAHNTFVGKRHYESSKDLNQVRSSQSDEIKRSLENLKLNSNGGGCYQNEWEKKPLDFNLRLYHPKPPKRNTRESMQPWKWDKYLRPIERESNTAAEVDEPMEKNNCIGLNYLLVNAMSTKSSLNNDDEDSRPENDDFQASFRLLTPNQARTQAAKGMSFRDGLEQYRNPMPHDFRGVSLFYL